MAEGADFELRIGTGQAQQRIEQLGASLGDAKQEVKELGRVIDGLDLSELLREVREIGTTTKNN